MDFFKLNKYNIIDENILYISKNLIEILEIEKELFLDELLLKYLNKQRLELTANIENSVFLSLLFLFSINKIEYESKITLKQWRAYDY